ncbi:MAG: sulfatase-like hydrolase/transferase [Vicinamibacteria bacterium]
MSIVSLAVLVSLLQTAWSVFHSGLAQAGLYWAVLKYLSTELFDAFMRDLLFLIYVGVPLAVMLEAYRPPFTRLKPALVAIFVWAGLWPVLGYGGNETNLGILEIGLLVIFLIFLVFLNPIANILQSLWGHAASVMKAFSIIGSWLGRRSCAYPGIAILALGLLVGPRFESLRASPSPPRPNVIFFVIDALRADHMSSYGYSRQTTPFLDAWSQSGFLFERAYSAESYTMASVPSLLTSFYPNVHQVLYDQPVIDTLAEGQVTLSEILDNAGYETAAFVFNPHLNAEYNFAQGFDHYDDNTPYLPQPEGMSHAEYWETAEKMRVRSLSWLQEARRAERPFFLYLHYRDVHEPYLPPPPYDKAFSATGLDETRDTRETFRTISDPEGRDRQYFLDLYDGEIRYTDDKIRVLAEALTSLGLMSNTIVVVTADHGEAFMEEHPDATPRYSHGGGLYEGDIHVPLVIMDLRAEPARKRIATPVSLVDVMPTILAMVNVDYRGDIQGSSLLPLMFDFENYQHPPVFAGGRLGRGAIIEMPWKYYARIDRATNPDFATRPASFPPLRPDGQLFSLTDDPLETRDLSDERPEVAAELRGKLEAWYEGGSAFRYEVKTEEIDSETLERLRSLGYVQ